AENQKKYGEDYPYQVVQQKQFDFFQIQLYHPWVKYFVIKSRAKNGKTPFPPVIVSFISF
ncbi:MAG: hypothetical protein V5A77_04585, partial [Candidatus Bipolaricaulota bacterium]